MPRYPNEPSAAEIAAFDGYPQLQSRLYTRPDNYAGAEFWGTVAVYGIHRDSDALEKSNYEVFHDKLTGQDGVEETDASHWAVGWVRSLRIGPNVSDELKAFCEHQFERLERYPVLNEEIMSRIESDEAQEWWDSEGVRGRLHFIAEFNGTHEGKRAPVSRYVARRAHYWDCPESFRDWWEQMSQGG